MKSWLTTRFPRSLVIPLSVHEERGIPHKMASFSGLFSYSQRDGWQQQNKRLHSQGKKNPVADLAMVWTYSDCLPDAESTTFASNL